MAQTFIKLLLLIFIHQHSVCTFDTDPRIIGGKKCDYDVHPYAVAIFTQFVCGGSLISLKWVLTAAHCVDLKLISQKRVLLRTGFDRKKLVQKRHAIKGIPHASYNEDLEDEVRFDIALMLADKPFIESAHLKPAKLPAYGFESKCKAITAMGVGEETKLKWNETPKKETKFSERLLCVELPIISRELCSKRWKSYTIDESIFCTMDKEGNRDTCYGDSGGPAVCDGVLIGVTAAGGGCGQPNTPGVFTRVEYYLKFIAENTDINVNVGIASGRSLINGSTKVVPGKVFLIVIFFLCHIMVNGFGY